MAWVRRRSSAFSRGRSRFRGVSGQAGHWEARIGTFGDRKNVRVTPYIDNMSSLSEVIISVPMIMCAFCLERQGASADMLQVEAPRKFYPFLGLPNPSSRGRELNLDPGPSQAALLQLYLEWW